MEKRTDNKVITERKPFQGVLNILSFNRHFYVFGLIVFILLFTLKFLLNWNGMSFWVVLIGFVYGLITPLIVSAYVYDFSGYYDLTWLNKIEPNQNDKLNIANINAGFDETSYILDEKFPNATIKAFDFYDAEKHTEASIKRARKVSLVYPNTQNIKTNNIPLESNSTDIIFLLSTAHEIRNNDEKVAFLKECKRIAKPNGRVIMVEHLRDFPNFLAFTIGYKHFFSKNTWEKAFMDAGFENFEETKFTPFMSIFKTY